MNPHNRISPLAIFGLAAVLLAIIVLNTLFIVSQTEQAIVLQFGNPVAVIRDPGLHMKIPGFQNVVFYDSRTLALEPPEQEVPLVDQKRIVVSSYARYKITNPLVFYQSVHDELNFGDRFGAILNGSVRDELGASQLNDLLTAKRDQVMQNIATKVRNHASEFGVEVVDVRISRTDLPPQTSQAVFSRMKSDRVAQAAKIRAEGEQIKTTIIAEADRDRTIVLADARRQSEILRGEGDASRNQILGQAYSKDPEFFRFYRSLDAYKNALATGTTLVLDPHSEFFKYLNSPPVAPH